METSSRPPFATVIIKLFKGVVYSNDPHWNQLQTYLNPIREYFNKIGLKDDSSRIGDRRNYILGWDNTAKIAAIEAELDLVNRDLNELNKQIKSLEKKRKQRQQQQSWLQALMNFTDFTEIDWRNTEQEKQKLVRDLEELEASSDRLKQLEFQLKSIQQQILEQERISQQFAVQYLRCMVEKHKDKS